MLDSESLPDVFANVLEDIVASNFAELALLVFNGENAGAIEDPGAQRKKSIVRKIARRIIDPKIRRKLMYDLYLTLDERSKPAGDPVKLVDCSDLLRDIDWLSVLPVRKGFVHRFPPDAIDAIRKYNLDVLLRFGFNILKGDVLNSARYGIWSYHHGDNELYRGGPAHFWEIYEHNPVSGVILQRLTETLDAGLVLCKALFHTADSLLVSQNRQSPYWDTSHFVIWKLNELHRYGWEYVQSRAVPNAPYQGKRKLYRNPTNWEIVKWLGPKVIQRVARKPLERPIVRHWRIAIRAGGTPIYNANANLKMNEFRFQESPKGHFWADPFLIQQDGKTYAFFEDYSYEEHRGVISCAEVQPDGGLGQAQVCLDTGTHLSYPMVFRHEGETYMIPESADCQNVVLYRATEFPYVWAPKKVLFEGVIALDTTAHRQNGLWWFFTTLAERGGNAKLMLFYANSLTGKWQYHPANPISSNIRRARAAGRIIWDGSRLLRPSQDGAPAYGHSFSFNEILTLTKAEYRERVFREISPTWEKNLIGTHTYNSCPGFEVVDGRAVRAAEDC
ncbi:MAG: glucosamine inositolphosphorylceramide transferase family protein [Bryobacteraceae bacterium]